MVIFYLWSVIFKAIDANPQPALFNSEKSRQQFGGTQHNLQSDLKVLHFTR